MPCQAVTYPALSSPDCRAVPPVAGTLTHKPKLAFLGRLACQPIPGNGSTKPAYARRATCQPGPGNGDLKLNLCCLQPVARNAEMEALLLHSTQRPQVLMASVANLYTPARLGCRPDLAACFLSPDKPPTRSGNNIILFKSEFTSVIKWLFEYRGHS